MLDTDTKRRIDTARDILVGKLPDPKSQVEQITIALIYKFMDDMDAQSEELGGERSFFSGKFQKYGWARLMRGGLGGHEMLGLYSEAIARMPENPGIPPLFRDIFKNAFLPYRDPETLRAFLKIIDDFEYDHSERLGDAFEYLLSVLGSQGDAGQFRTPRHIIDFIVEIIDPKKDETVLDPACGTAGFLISAYKHILKANTDENGNSTLTPDERQKLAANFRGYDISPDMVRLSLVNMYLHGFPDPQIHEYDTLSSLDRWNEHADVILANPPFMSPKGGIQPHKRFSVQSKRSEVLFVDYIAEHLTPNGRAGIIVPEGVVFQSQTAYRQLRKMLVEDYLVAVISLPAGVFNPYSGVKTSILILDKALAKQSESVAFFKITADGFDLGAQRRPSGRSDIPQVLGELEEHLRVVRARLPVHAVLPTLGLAVAKDVVAANGDYSLSGERYKEIATRSSRFPVVRLGNVAQVIAGQSPPGESYNDSGTGVPFYQGKTEFGRVFIGRPRKWTSDPLRFAEADDVVMSVRAPVGPVNRATQRICIGRGLAAIRPKEGRLLSAFAFYVLRSIESDITGDAGAAFASISRRDIEDIEIPLPPIDVQEEITGEIEGDERVISGARAVLDNYRPRIPIHPAWPVVELGEIIDGKPRNGYSGKPVDRVTAIKVLSLSATTSGKLDPTKVKYLDEYVPSDAHYRCQRGDIYLQRGNTPELVGTAALFDIDEPNYIYPDLMIRVRADPRKVDSRYLLVVLQSQPVRDYLKINALGAAGSMPKINQSIVERIPIPLPALTAQQAIVDEIETEQAMVAANRELIARMNARINVTLSRLWENSTPAPAMDSVALA